MSQEPLPVALKVLWSKPSSSTLRPREHLNRKVVAEPHTELALAANRVHGHQHRGFEELLWGVLCRPVCAYMASNFGPSSASTASTTGLILLIGCSRRVRLSVATVDRIVTCRVVVRAC